MKKNATLLALIFSINAYSVTLSLHGQLTGNSFLGGIPINIYGVAGVNYYNTIYTDPAGNFSLSNIVLTDLQGGLSVTFYKADGSYSASNRYFTSTTTILDYNTIVFCTVPFTNTMLSYSGTIAGAPAGTQVNVTGYLGSNYSNIVFTDSSGYFADSNIVSTLPVGSLSFSYVNPNCNGTPFYGYSNLYFNTSWTNTGNLGMLSFCDSIIFPPFQDSLVPVALHAHIVNAPLNTPVTITYLANGNYQTETWNVIDNAGTIKKIDTATVGIHTDILMISYNTGYVISISYFDCNSNLVSTNLVRHINDTVLNYQNSFCPPNTSVTIDGWVKAVNPNNPSQLITPQSRVYLIRNYTNLASGDSIVSDSTLTDASGYYKFAGVYIWDYSIKATVLTTDSNYSSFFPTYELPNSIGNLGSQYSHSSLSWQNSIFQGYQNTTLPVELIAGNNTGGPGFISGIVQQGAGRTNGSGHVSHIPVYILNSLGEPAQYTYTNSTGQFSFSNLAYGFYSIAVDYYSKPCQPTYFSLDGSVPNNQFIFFTIESTEITSSLSYTSIEDFNNKTVKIFPNPVKDMCNLSFGNSNLKQIIIQNILGETMMQVATNSKSEQLNLSELSKGVYLITVIENNKRQTSKLVKE